MNTKKTNLFENGLIWFGAAVSLAEIQTGTYFASLGFLKGFLAIVIGHLIGCTLLFLAGVIGGKTEKSAMETVKLSFGSKGALIFAFLNIIQLIGWTAIMIFDGALAANNISSLGNPFWAIIIGALIILWILAGIKNLGRLNTLAMASLFILTVVLSFIIFKTDGPTAIFSSDALTFGAAVELSVAMPLSWLPLVSDYTKDAAKPIKASAVSAIIYGLISSWMYIIGMGSAILAGSSDIAEIILKSGLGILGLIIVVLSTVTTTFLDAYSAGISSESISKKVNGRYLGVLVTVIGVSGAVFLPLSNITDFLYFIGSVFAPMIAIQITDFFIFKRNSEEKNFCVKNIIIWFLGFILYRFLMKTDFILGSTFLDMLITSLICICVNLFRKKEIR